MRHKITDLPQLSEELIKLFCQLDNLNKTNEPYKTIVNNTLDFEKERAERDNYYRMENANILDKLDKSYYKKLSSMPSITSPEIGTLQNCLHLYHNSDDIKHQLPDHGYLNCHICFIAETKIEHKECDSSYTIITVPNQPVKSSKQQNFNLLLMERK